MQSTYHVGQLAAHKRSLLHIGSVHTVKWMLNKFPQSTVYEVQADLSKPIEMQDSGRAHYLPSMIAEDLGMEVLACYLRKHGELESDLVKALSNKGYTCIHYVNQNECKGSDSWIVWNWECTLLGDVRCTSFM